MAATPFQRHTGAQCAGEDVLAHRGVQAPTCIRLMRGFTIAVVASVMIPHFREDRDGIDV